MGFLAALGQSAPGAADLQKTNYQPAIGAGLDNYKAATAEQAKHIAMLQRIISGQAGPSLAEQQLQPPQLHYPANVPDEPTAPEAAA